MTRLAFRLYRHWAKRFTNRRSNSVEDRDRARRRGHPGPPLFNEPDDEETFVELIEMDEEDLAGMGLKYR
jgi:hypothetical protein